jgi:hypothetical protein
MPPPPMFTEPVGSPPLPPLVFSTPGGSSHSIDSSGDHGEYSHLSTSLRRQRRPTTWVQEPEGDLDSSENSAGSGRFFSSLSPSRNLEIMAVTPM